VQREKITMAQFPGIYVLIRKQDYSGGSVGSTIKAGVFGHQFATADFSGAQTGPAAFIVPRNALWISGLSADPSAQWIGTNANAGCCQGNTALYAVTFPITKNFVSASLTLHFAALHVGTNWLYIENGNALGSAGLLFSATITTSTRRGRGCLDDGLFCHHHWLAGSPVHDSILRQLRQQPAIPVFGRADEHFRR
jgi:hypothetical protein